MDPSKPNDKQRKSANRKNHSVSSNMDTKNIPQSSKDKLMFDENKCKMNTQNQPSTSCEASKDKAITDLFPWLIEAKVWNTKHFGYMGQSQTRLVLQAMDFVIENLSTDHDKYSKSPKVCRALASFLRRIMFSYHLFLNEYEKGKDYYQRITSLLATLTDIELLASLLGKELDVDVANRLQLSYSTYLKTCTDETCILDILMNVKRILRLHGSILNPLLKYNLVKLTIDEPVEVSDDVFIKHLIPFKKWLSLANFPEEREAIRSRFNAQLKPPMSLGSNPTYANLLPVEKEVTQPSDNFVHLLDAKYSVEPLVLTFKPAPSNNRPNIIVKEISEVYEILSDDEDDNKIKIEPIASTSKTSTSNASSKPKTVDLTEEDEIEWPTHYISWMADLLERARANAKTIDQRLQVASVSHDIIVIDDVEEENNDEIEITTQLEDERQNENVSIESDEAKYSSNQFDQQGQTNDGNTQKQLNNSNDQSIDSISLDVNQIDDDLISPLEDMRTDNIDIGSDMPEKQIANIDLGNEEAREQHTEMDKVDDNTELTLCLERMTTNDSEIKNDSANNESLTNRTISTPTLFTEPVMTEENVLNEDLVDNVQTEQHSTEQSSIQDEDSTTNYRSNAVNRVNNIKQSTIKVVHLTRHNEWNDNDKSNPMSNETEVLNTTQCSIPLAQIKTNTLILRNSDEKIKGPEQSQQNDKIDIDSTNSDRNGKLILKSIQKMSPNPNSDRTMSRSAQTSTNDTNNISDNNVPLVNRRKVTEQIDNENIPSAIMERKTYIKPVNVGTKSTNKSQQQINCRQISLQASPTTSDLMNEQPQQQQHHHQHKQTTSPKNAATASVKQPPKTYKVFHSDEILPILTPYDDIPAKYLRKRRLAKPPKPSSPQTTLKLSERFAECNITQESLAKAASQLVEICKNTSPSRNAERMNTSGVVERRNGRRLPASTVTTTTTKQATTATAATPATITRTPTDTLTKRSPATKMPMPNYIVTKVTEKKRINVNDGREKLLNQTPRVELLNKTSNIKSIRGSNDIAKTNVRLETQEQKPMNKCDSNSIIDDRANTVYSLNLNTHNKSSINTKLMQKNGAKSIGFPVTIVRTKDKNDSIRICDDKSLRPPILCKLISNGSTNLEASGKNVRLVKVVEIKKVKIIPKASTVKIQAHLPMANFRKVTERKRSSSVPGARSINKPLYEEPKKLVRRNSCYIDGIKINNLVEEAAAKNSQFAQLHEICSNIILMGLPKLQTVKKRGRPKKPIYKSTAKDLLNSAEFSVKADLLKLNEQYCKEKNSFFDKFINFHMNTGLEKLSRLKINNNNSSIKLLSTSSQRSELLCHFPDEQNQEIGDLFESSFIDNDLDCVNNLTIELVSDLDEITSPVYEPHISADASNSTDHLESTVQINEFNKLNNDEQFHFVNAKIIEALPDLYNPYLFQDSFVFNDVANEVTIELTDQISKTHKDDRTVSPIRRSSRKRKIPVAFVSTVKRTRR